MDENINSDSNMLTISGTYGDIPVSDESTRESPRTSGVISDWSEVNRQLRHHGFHPVMVLPRNRIDQIPKGAVILEEHTTQHLRHTLESLMSDCDRRQALVQELISASNRMQRENKEQIESIHRYETEIRELEQQLETEQVNVQEMEDRRLSELHRHGKEINDLQMSKTEVMALFNQMEQKIAKKDDEIARLQKRCQDLVHKEEARLDRQTKIFRHFKSRSPHKQNAVDQRMLEIIDSYEAKVDELKEELELLKKERENHNASYVGSYGDVESDNKVITEEDSDNLASGETSEEGQSFPDRTSPADRGPKTGSGGQWRKEEKPQLYISVPSPRRLKEIEDKIIYYEKHLKDAKKLIKLLESENTHLKLELQTRPMPEEWKKTRKYNKKLEKILAKNNLCAPSRKRHMEKDSAEQIQTKQYSTRVDHIDLLPIDICRDYLKEICSGLAVLDLRDLADRLKSVDLMTEAFPSMEKLITDILALTEEKGTLKLAGENLHQSIDTHAVFCQRAWQNILPTLRLWSKELHSLKDLQKAIIDLSISLLPWKPETMFQPNDSKPVLVKELKALVVSLSNQDRRARPSDLRGSEKPSLEQLQSMIAHFQKLFDVSSVSGVFPRMNELYMRVGEVYNAMHTIRELLNLDPSCRSGDVVNAVGKLSKAKHLLKVDDLTGTIQRLEQYDEFFPPFQSMVKELCKLLGVEKMDEIITAVRALIQFPNY